MAYPTPTATVLRSYLFLRLHDPLDDSCEPPVDRGHVLELSEGVITQEDVCGDESELSTVGQIGLGLLVIVVEFDSCEVCLAFAEMTEGHPKELAVDVEG